MSDALPNTWAAQEAARLDQQLAELRAGVVSRAEAERLLLPGVPERANREGDQALPAEGQQDVFEAVIGWLRERQQVGIKRYGRSLQTFNGRDAPRDLREELLDALVYAGQDELERRKLERQLAATRALLAKWREQAAAFAVVARDSTIEKAREAAQRLCHDRTERADELEAALASKDE